MNALAREEVGNYLNTHFISSYQKIGTFRIVNGNKQGGNVASYFCTPDGRVLHLIAGPVDGDTFLREARWVIDNWKLAQLYGPADALRLMAYFRKAHAERLHKEYGIEVKRMTFAPNDPTAALLASLFDTQHNGRKAADQAGRVLQLNKQGKVHFLLAAYPLVKIDQIYELVFEKILKQKVSTLPVAVRN